MKSNSWRVIISVLLAAFVLAIGITPFVWKKQPAEPVIVQPEVSDVVVVGPGSALRKEWVEAGRPTAYEMWYPNTLEHIQLWQKFVAEFERGHLQEVQKVKGWEGTGVDYYVLVSVADSAEPNAKSCGQSSPGLCAVIAYNPGSTDSLVAVFGTTADVVTSPGTLAPVYENITLLGSDPETGKLTYSSSPSPDGTGPGTRIYAYNTKTGETTDLTSSYSKP